MQGVNDLNSEKKDKLKVEGRASSDSPSNTRIITHTQPEVQYSFRAAKDAPLPLFAGKPLPQRLSQTFETLASSFPEAPIGLGISERPISEYDSAPEISTAVRASRVPLGERTMQTTIPKIAVPVTREPWRGASGMTEQLTPISDAQTPANPARISPEKGSYFHPRRVESLTSTEPDASDRTIETPDLVARLQAHKLGNQGGLAVPEIRTWRSASTGNPEIHIETLPSIVQKKEHNSPKSVTRWNWAAKGAVDRPPGTPESTLSSSGTWPHSRLSEIRSNPTMREVAAAQATAAKSGAKPSKLAPIPQSPILNRKRPIPRDRDVPEKTAAEARAEAEARMREMTPPQSDAGDASLETSDVETPRALPYAQDNYTRDNSPAPPSIHIPKLRNRSPPRDRAAVLQTELDNITSRRRTLERLIRNITEFAPRNPMIRDLATRREEAERLKLVERELAETRRREHDVGLKLVKAWQKRGFTDGEQFWVRRVTK